VLEYLYGKRFGSSQTLSPEESIQQYIVNKTLIFRDRFCSTIPWLFLGSSLSSVQWTWRHFTTKLNYWGVKLNTHFRLVSGLGMREDIPLLPRYIFMTWCLIRHRNNIDLLCQLIRSGFKFAALEDSSNLHSVTFIRPRNLQDFFYSNWVQDLRKLPSFTWLSLKWNSREYYESLFCSETNNVVLLH